MRFFDENFPLCLKKSGLEISVESVAIYHFLPHLCNSREIKVVRWTPVSFTAVRFLWGGVSRSPRRKLTPLISRFSFMV